MADKDEKYADIEETLFNILRAGAGDMDHGNLLILLSLVNLMGIINIINYRAGMKKDPLTGKEVFAAPAAGQANDPASLLSMLGGGGKPGPGFNPGQLEGLVRRFMGSPPGRPAAAAHGEQQKDVFPAENGENVNPAEKK